MLEPEINPKGYPEAENVNVTVYAPGKPKREPSLLDWQPASTFSGMPVPVRRFHDAKGMIPATGVTLLQGDGGTGKSLLVLQLAVATATQTPWLGVTVRSGAALYYSCEDGEDEVHIRLSQILPSCGRDFADLDGLKVDYRVGKDCVLCKNDGKGIIKATALFDALKASAKAQKPALIVIDNAVDVFAGDANDAAQVKQFMHHLFGLSIEANAPVVLLAHPSKSGMANGTGDGGSVHWSNSARSRLYLSRVITLDDRNLPTENDPCARSLKVMKANYSSTGDAVDLRWQDGVFVAEMDDREAGPADPIGSQYKAERVFLKMLRTGLERGIYVSANRASRTFAPLVFSRNPASEKVSKRAFEIAMEALFERGMIASDEHGRGQSKRSHIAFVEGE